MLIYDVDYDTAFKVIVWRSQETNTKLKVLADQLLADITSLRRAGGSFPDEATVDYLLMSAHERAAARAESSTLNEYKDEER